MRLRILTVIVICVWAGILYAAEPGQQFGGFNLEGYKNNGQKAWVVNGDQADIHGNQIDISNVDAETYGDEKVNLTAKTGMIDQTSGNIHLEKDVVITSETGAQLTTDSLDWHRSEDLVKTKEGVVITDKGMTATGTGMDAHPGLKTAQIHEDVTVTMQTQPGTVTITCDGPMSIDQAKSMAVFQDNVVAVQEDQTLTADRMEIYFDEKEKQIKEMICIGHVVIVRGENKTFADRAVYNGSDRKLVLTGRPKLILVTEGNNVFTSVGD